MAIVSEAMMRLEVKFLGTRRLAKCLPIRKVLIQVFNLLYICCYVVLISKLVIVVDTWNLCYMVAEQLLCCHLVVLEYRADNVH
jgi:hypothetical protein